MQSYVTVKRNASVVKMAVLQVWRKQGE